MLVGLILSVHTLSFGLFLTETERDGICRWLPLWWQGNENVPF